MSAELLTPVVTAIDEFTPLFERMRGVLTGEQGAKAVGAAVAQLFKRHLIKKNAEPNKSGFPKSNFYGQAAEKVKFQAFPYRVSVEVAHEGIAQRFYGGTIKPVNKQALTIPVHPDAYAHRAPEFKDLKLVKSTAGGKTVAMLVRNSPGKMFGEVYYVLVKSVTQQKDPSVFPDRETVLTTAINALDRRIEREKR